MCTRIAMTMCIVDIGGTTRKMGKVAVYAIVGIMMYNNKDKYDGQWSDDMKEGLGKMLVINQ